MPAPKKLILLGVVAIVLVIIYFQVLGTIPKWAEVSIKHYDGKVLASQEFDPALQTGTEKRKGRKARAYFNYDPELLKKGHPVVRAYLNENIDIYHKVVNGGKRVEQWRLSGSLDGGMKDVVPGGGKVIEGTSYSVKGWTIEWWKHPTSLVKVIIITDPNGKSRTFRIEWSPK